MRIGGNDTSVGIDNKARTIGFTLLLRFENNFRRPLNVDDRGLEGCYFFRPVMLGVSLRILKKLIKMFSRQPNQMRPSSTVRS
jgi:hypothetical protein